MNWLIEVPRRVIPRRVRNAYHFLTALLAVIWYRYPARKLTVSGVTGTDGKTTTTQAIFSILKETAEKASLINTIGAIVSDDHREPIGLHVTTPNPFLLQRLLKDVKEGGGKYVVLEVTSHGLDQHRVWGCNFKYGVVTNITHEHLDYHKTYSKYLEAKARLLKSVSFSILNMDDQSFPLLLKRTSSRIITYGLNSEADFTATDIEVLEKGMRFKIPSLGVTVCTPLLGDYNIQNLLAAIAVTSTMGISSELIVAGLAKMSPPPGRLEKIESERDFDVYIDFAHTPNALQNVLSLLRHLTSQKLIVVFGCAGERDREKRRPMGRIASTYCDYVVLTAEDPRTEDLDTIVKEIAIGCEEAGGREGKSYFRINDRSKAIDFAINNLAQPGDIVVVTGKAHEKSMCYGKTEYPWNEFEAVAEAVRKK